MKGVHSFIHFLEDVKYLRSPDFLMPEGVHKTKAEMRLTSKEEAEKMQILQHSSG